MAERFGEVVNFGVQDTSTGASGELRNLVNSIQGIKTQALQQATESAVQRGINKAGATELKKINGVTQAPEKKNESFFGRNQNIAFNRAMASSYVASLGNDINESVGRIESEFSDDIIKFNDTVAGFAKGTINGVDPAVRGQVATFLNGRVSAASSRVRGRDTAKKRKIAEGQLELSAKTAIDEANVFARSGDLLSSSERLVEYSTVVQSMVDSGFISQTEAAIKVRDAEFNATRETISGGINRQMQVGDYIGAVESISNFRKRIPKGFTIEEHDEVVSVMTAEVNESLSLRNKLEDLQVDNVKSDQNDNYLKLFVGVADGIDGNPDVLMAVKRKEITIEQASKLIGTLNTRGQGVDEWATVTDLQDRIRNGEDVSDDIVLNTGVNLTQSTASSLLSDNQQAKDRESPLQTSNAKRAEGFITQSMRVTGPFGALDTGAERRLATSRREFSERVLAGEDPWQVADELVGKDEFDRAGNPKFGNKQQLDKSLELLSEALLSNQIDDDTFNFEHAKLERLIQLRDNIEAFNKSKKGAEDANR